MSLFKVSFFYGPTMDPEKKYSLTFGVQAPTMQSIQTYLPAASATMDGLFYTTATVWYARVSTFLEDGPNFAVVNLNIQGSVAVQGDSQPPFVIARATANVGTGRPAVKQLRLSLTERDVQDGRIADPRREDIAQRLTNITNGTEDIAFGVIRSVGTGWQLTGLTGPWTVQPDEKSRRTSRKKRSPGTL